MTNGIFDSIFGTSGGSDAPPSGGVSPELAALMQAQGISMSDLLHPKPDTGSQSQSDLAAALMQSALEISSPYANQMPWWAQGLRSQVISEDQFGKVYKAGDGIVFMGEGDLSTSTDTPANKFASEMGGPYQTETTSQDYALTVTQARGLPYTWDDKEVADAMKRLKAAGLQVDSFDMGSNSLVAVWSSLVNRAAQTYALTDGKRKLTPWDVLDLYKNEADTTGTGPFTGSKSYTTKQVTDITEGQAFTVQQKVLSELLGRDPSDQEVRDYLYRMNQLASQNPAITKTITEFKNGKRVGTTVHTDPGFTGDDMAQAAYDQAQAEPDYAEYRGASYLFNAAMSALGPIGG